MNVEDIINVARSIVIKKIGEEPYTYYDYEFCDDVSGHHNIYLYTFEFQGKLYDGSDKYSADLTMSTACGKLLSLCREANVPHMTVEEAERQIRPRIFS